MQDETESTPREEAGGTLADAIAAHLALKRDHGADSESIEHELEEALSPPRRDEPVAETAAPVPEPVPAPEPAPAPAPAPAPEPAPELEPEPAPIAQPEPAPEPVDEPAPGEITGTIEFEFGAEESAPEPAPESTGGHDLLEETPDFFEETPEHDKLWFDEAPPRKFDF